MAWTVLQSASGTTHAGTTAAATLGTLTAGTKLIAYVSCDSFFISTVKDTAGNSFTNLNSANFNSGFGNGGIYVLDTPSGDAGAGTTVTLTITGSADLTIVVQEVAGLAAGTTASLDGGALVLLTGTATGSAQGPPSYTSTASNEFLAYALLDNGGTTGEANPAGYTADAHNVLNGNSSVEVCYKNSTGGTETGQFTPGAGSLGWVLAMAAFHLAATPHLAGTGSAASGAVIGATAQLAGTGSAAPRAVIGATAQLAGTGLASAVAAGPVHATAQLAGTGLATAAGPVRVTASLAGTGSAGAGIAGVLAEDASTPPTAQTAGGSSTQSLDSAAFTPPAGSLLVALCVVNYAAYPGSPPVLSVSDSGGGTWTSGTQTANAAALTVSNIFTRPCPASPGSITVTLSRGSDASAALVELAVRVLNGANLSQAGAAQHNAAGSSAAFADTVTTRVTGSLVYICGTGAGTGQSAAALANTTQIDNRYDTPDTGLLLFGRATAVTVTPGAGSPGAVGFTLGSSAAWAVTGLEILPASGDSGAAALAGTGSAAAHPAIGVTASLAGTGSVVHYLAETSPGLELSGFGSFGGVPSNSVINSVAVAVAEHQSGSGQAPCTFELWDYSGAPARIGTPQTGNQGTSTANVSNATFTGATFAMLATLRVRVYGYGQPGTGSTESVDSVSLTVNYSAPGTAAVTASLAGAGHATVPGPPVPGSIRDEAVAAVLDEAGTPILDESGGLSAAAIGGTGSAGSGVAIRVTAALAGAGSATTASAAISVTGAAAGAGSATAASAAIGVTAQLAGAGTASSGAALGVTAAPAGSGSSAAAPVIGVTATLAGAGTASSGAAIGVTAAAAGAGRATAASVTAASVTAAPAGAGTASSGAALGVTAAIGGAGQVTALATIGVTASPAGTGQARGAATATANLITAAAHGAGSAGSGVTIRVTAALAGTGGAAVSLARPPLFLTATLAGTGRAFEQFYRIDISVTVGIAVGVLSAGASRGDGWAVRATRPDGWGTAASRGDGLAASGASSDGGVAAATKNDGTAAGASKGVLTAGPSVAQR